MTDSKRWDQLVGAFVEGVTQAVPLITDPLKCPTTLLNHGRGLDPPPDNEVLALLTQPPAMVARLLYELGVKYKFNPEKEWSAFLPMLARQGYPQ